jgi:uncharacterized repeat protein (TIGR02543 family)
MKTNILKNLRWAVCAALLAVGSTAFAATATINFSNDGTNVVGSGSGSTWSFGGDCVADVSSGTVNLLIDGTGYIYGKTPYGSKDWRISSIVIDGASGTGITASCGVNGVSFTTSDYTFTGSTLAQGIVTIKLVGSNAEFSFTSITVTYEEVNVPQVSFVGADGLTSTSTIVVNFSADMYINSKIISSAVYDLVENGIDFTDGDGNAIAKTFVVDNNKQITVTTTGIKNCDIYELRINELLVNADGIPVYSYANSNSVAYTSHEEVFTITGKGVNSTLYVGETFTPKTDLVVKADGVDVTSECTFTTISTATAGSQTLTITHGACTTTQVITVTERTPCTITWVNNVTGETLAQGTVYQGISLSESGLTTLPSPSTKVAETDCGTKSFVGWSKTQISGSTDEAPALITTSSVPNAASYTFYAVYADGSSTSEGWTKVTSISELDDLVGKQILFACVSNKVVMGEQRDNNFNSTSASIASDGILTPSSDYTAVTLGGSTDSWTFMTEKGYLYCSAAKKNNYLDTIATLCDRAKWKIEFSSNKFIISSVGYTGTNNEIRYNTTSTFFSCYTSTGSGVALDLYYNASHTGYITKCQCTTPTWSGSLPTSIGQGASLSFGITSNSTGAITYSCSNSNVTITGDKFQVSADGSYDIVITQAAADGYCKKTETRTMTISVGDCSAQSFHFGVDGQSGWDYLCFDADANERHIYNFTIPSTASHYYVANQKIWDNNKSETVQFKYMPLALLQGKSGDCNTTIGWDAGVSQGAVGTLRIYPGYSDKNWYIGFIPDGYVFRIGTDALGWTSMAFTATNDTKTVWETELVTLTANNIASNYYVGLKTNTTDGYVWCNNSATLQVTSIGVRAASDWSGSNLSSSYVGKKGTFRIWADNCDGKNWLCHFVPYYDITYMNADNSTAFETSGTVSIEATDKSMTIISTNPEKTGYRFVGWSETANATTATYTAGASITLTKNHVLYPVYVQQVTLTYDTNGGTSECGTPQYDINSTADLCTEVERTGYAFKGWSKVKDDATQIVTGSITMNANQTLYAIWEKCLTVTYLTSGLTLNGGCSAAQTTDASGNTLVAGSSVTLCAQPTSNSGYTFVKWKVSMDGVETEYDAGVTVTLTADATVQARWDTPDFTAKFINQGAGDNGRPDEITVTVPLETYATAPSTTNVPQSCDGKQFIGWTNVKIEEETDYDNVDELTQAGYIFLSPGEKFMVTNTTPQTWYAVFGTPE